MRYTPQELVQKRRFEDVYERSQAPVMRSIERRVCGCDFGGKCWTTQIQADELVARLHLRPGTRLPVASYVEDVPHSDIRADDGLARSRKQCPYLRAGENS